MKIDGLKKDRILYLYSCLVEGKGFNIAEAGERFKCSVHSIHRDINDLRSFFYNSVEQNGIEQKIVYDRKERIYRLEPPARTLLSNEEVFAVVKILLESRALTKQELYPIINKLVDCCVPRDNKRLINNLISNEKFHYVELQHKQALLAKLWDISQAVQKHKELLISYRRTFDKMLVERRVQPVGIMFSEFYFYLAAFIPAGENVKFEVENDKYPTIYRIDRIENYMVQEKRFKVPYQNRFEEGEFRKRIQFMYGGQLQKIKFLYKGPSVEAVLDRLPTAKVIEKKAAGYLLTAEVFGKGIEMWLRSQGDMVKLME